MQAPHLRCNIIGLFSQLLHLFVVVPPLECHLLVLPLKPFNCLLWAEFLVFGMFLGTFKFFLCIEELFSDALVTNISKRGKGYLEWTLTSCFICSSLRSIVLSSSWSLRSASCLWDVSSEKTSFSMVWSCSTHDLMSWQHFYQSREPSWYIDSANLLDIKQRCNFGLQVACFRFVHCYCALILNSGWSHCDNCSFDTLRGLNDPRTGTYYWLSRHDRFWIQRFLFVNLFNVFSMQRGKQSRWSPSAEALLTFPLWVLRYL